MRRLTALFLALLLFCGNSFAFINEDDYEAPSLMMNVRPDALLGYWKFDEGSGTVANDVTGGHIGTLVNSPTYGPGISGSALTFTGASSMRVEMANAPLIGDGATWTIAGWINTTTTSNGTIYGEGNTGAATQRIAMTINHDVTGDFACVPLGDVGQGDGYFSSGNLSINDGKPHLLVCTSESKSHRNMFFDGVWKNSSNVTLGTLTLNTATVGAVNLNGYLAHLTGTLDQVGVWNIALSTAEVNQLFNQRR